MRPQLCDAEPLQLLFAVDGLDAAPCRQLPFAFAAPPGFVLVRSPGGTVYLRCHVCSVRLGDVYLDDGRIAVCLSCQPQHLPEEPSHVDEIESRSATR